jgi:two-component system chemotaxis response regulator CheY
MVSSLASLPLSDATHDSGVFRAVRPNVLLLDPDAGVRADMEVALAPRFTVHEVGDPLRALEIAMAVRPAVIVVELTLPHIDGLAFMKLLRTRPALRNVPFIVVSSEAGPREIERAITAGARRYLVKPCVPDTLADIVSRIAHR